MLSDWKRYWLPPFLHSTLPFANEFSGECDELKAGSDLENIKDNAEEMWNFDEMSDCDAK